MHSVCSPVSFLRSLSLLALSLWSAPAGAQPALVPLTLEEALDAVEQTSIAVLLSRELVAQSVELANQSRGALLPNVTLDATQRRSRTASVGGALVRSGINNRFDTALNGRADLLNPQRIAAYQAARAAIDVAQLDLAATRETVRATVAETYVEHLRNQRRIEVLDANIARARALLDLARRQADAGVATQIDVTRAEALLATAEQARLQQDTVLQASEFRLKRILGLDLSTPLALAPFTIRRIEAAPVAVMLEEAAFEQRADYLRAKKQLEQNELEVRAARFARLPALALIGSYGYATENVLDGNESRIWSGSVAFSLPVFDGNRIRALTQLALSRRRAQELRVRDLAQGISAEVRLATQDARSRLAQVAVAERSLRLAQDELALAQRRFEQGVADNREIIEAQNRLALSSDALVEAIYQYDAARVELARARGEVRSILADRTE